ncbi:MAG: hypothetical protein K9L17_00635 [Clostridiales bacterium]|nr:hypothetical protein [Clostridiales bacterium]MCF8021198.1 hypothetical protein [Clostridiales bacterium]
MTEFAPRINIFCGNLGSGKTEIAINYAVSLYEKGKQVGLVDIDVVNPYFRSRIVRDNMKQRGIDVICPAGELAAADVPALPPSIFKVLQNPEITGVFDVGGDDIGAVVLGRFKPYFQEGLYNLYFVVNTSRPFTGDVNGIINYLKSIEEASRLKVTAFVNNSNLGFQTDIDTVLEGQEKLKEAAAKTGIPLAFTASLKHLVPSLESKLDVPVFPLEIYMVPPWQVV